MEVDSTHILHTIRFVKVVCLAIVATLKIVDNVLKRITFKLKFELIYFKVGYTGQIWPLGDFREVVVQNRK